MRVNLRELAEAAAHDPAKPLWEAAGDLKDYQVNYNLLLVATYVPPPRMFKNASGEMVPFYSSDKALDEERFQGKAALVLKIGEYDEDFIGLRPKAGDWIVYHPSNGTEVFIRDRRKANEGLSARLLDARYVFMIVSDPSLIY